MSGLAISEWWWVKADGAVIVSRLAESIRSVDVDLKDRSLQQQWVKPLVNG